MSNICVVSGVCVRSQISCFCGEPEKQNFLLVHVDDLKMAGKKENLAPMWEKMTERMNLEDPKIWSITNILVARKRIYHT